jgi:hypothetical protein
VRVLVAQAREMAERLGSFRRECGFYAALRAAPAMATHDAAAAAVTPTSASPPPPPPPPLPAPGVWFSRHNPATGGACLLFEDLGSTWTAGDQVAGASPSLAAAVVRDAAALHAAFWGDARLEAWMASGWLPCLDGPLLAGFDPALFGDSWPRWRARFPDAAAALPPRLAATLDADAGAFPAAATRLLTRCGCACVPLLLCVMPSFAQSTCPCLTVLSPTCAHRLGAAPRTLLHGDLRMDNVLWRPPPPASSQQEEGGTENAPAAALPSTRYIDMGDCAAGRGPFDIAYFMSMSLDTQARAPGGMACMACLFACSVRLSDASHSQVRRAVEAPLLAQYAAALAAGGVRGYGPADVASDYRAATRYVLCLAVNLGGAPGLEDAPPRKRALAAAMARRIAAAVADAGAGELLPK